MIEEPYRSRKIIEGPKEINGNLGVMRNGFIAVMKYYHQSVLVLVISSGFESISGFFPHHTRARTPIHRLIQALPLALLALLPMLSSIFTVFLLPLVVIYRHHALKEVFGLKHSVHISSLSWPTTAVQVLPLHLDPLFAKAFLSSTAGFLKRR
jgi:hypothetical protein